MYKRTIDLNFVKTSKSAFLFGPRQTGKSTLLEGLFPDAFKINLLFSDIFHKYVKSPSLLREEVLARSQSQLIVIDEIQKIPELLNEVHYLIEKGYKFILTGSSANKLRREGTNLLAGRARTRFLFPLTTHEIPQYDLNRLINFGAIPSIYLSDDPLSDLRSYVGTYLKEEIAAEGLVRKLHDFTQFLEVAAISNTELINFSNIASDVGVSAITIKSYFDILESTLIGKLLRPYSKKLKRKSISTSKFYFFDIGVANVLAKRFQILPKSELYGKCLEHLIFCELSAWISYQNDLRELTFWRSRNKDEVDFILGDSIAIEVKATDRVQEKHTKGLKALEKEMKLTQKIIVSLDNSKRFLEDEIVVYPIKEFLADLWSNKF